MNLTDRLTITRSRPRMLRRTVRLRLTILYSVLFLAAGGGLLATTYLLVRSAGDGNEAKPLKSLVTPGGKLVSGKTSNPLKSLVSPGAKSLSKKPPTTEQMLKATELKAQKGVAELKAQARAAVKAQALATHTTDLHQLLTRSGIALAIMAVLAVVLGWLVAGRMLRPLRTMASAAQQITEHNLHKRLALPGPSDEIKDLADTIDGLLQRLQGAFDAQRRFVANAAHELRTPLTLNRALLDVALANPRATAEELRTMGQELIASGEQQEQLIDALLTLATSERGLEHHEPFDLSEVTEGVLLGRHPEIEELGLELQSAIASAPVIGDPRLAERLVANLLDNAIGHNVSGGYINIATRTESGHAILRITNSGPIIPEDEVDRFFQPFQRLHTERAYHPNGHGLGLSIVQSIAVAHQATITAKPQIDGGLAVEVAFPRCDSHGDPDIGEHPRSTRATASSAST